MSEPNHFIDTNYHPLNDLDRRWEINLEIGFTDVDDQAGAWGRFGGQVFAATREQAYAKAARVLSVVTERMAELKASMETRKS